LIKKAGITAGYNAGVQRRISKPTGSPYEVFEALTGINEKTLTGYALMT